MQHKIMETTLDLVKLNRERREWASRALAALLQAHIDGRLTAQEHRNYEVGMRLADADAYTPARKVTFIADCKAIVKHFGGRCE